MSNAPRSAVLVPSSLDFLGVIDDLEADIPYRFYHQIRLPPDGAVVPLQDQLFCLFHLRRQLSSVPDQEFARVEIDRHRGLLIILVIVEAKSILVIIFVVVSRPRTVIIDTHTPPK